MGEKKVMLDLARPKIHRQTLLLTLCPPGHNGSVCVRLSSACPLWRAAVVSLFFVPYLTYLNMSDKCYFFPHMLRLF